MAAVLPFAETPAHIASGNDYLSEKEELESPGASTIDQEIVKDWTDEEERVVRRKLDCLVMPLVMFGFFCFQIERGNISNALTSTFLKDVHITQNQFNTGQGVLYLGIVLLEIPSNLVIQRIGPQIWLTFNVFAFGLVSTLQMFQHNYSGFLATRILLGVTESGYIPGALYLISTFYKKSELASRNGALFCGSGLASAVTGLFAYGILQLSGKHGLAGWQYLFLIEGLIAIFGALVFLLLLPHSPERPNPLFFPKFSIFTDRERQILVRRVVLDDERKATTQRPITAKEVLHTVSNIRNYPHILFSMCNIAVTGCLSTYLPTLIKGFGFETLKANALSSVGSWIALVIIFTLGWISDRTNIRGPMAIVGGFFYWVFWVSFQQKSLSTDKWVKYGLLTMASAFSQVWHPLNATWLSLNQATPQQRSIAMAMFVMSANTGAAVGSQILRSDDAPQYKRGFKVCVALVSFALLVAIFQTFQYRWSNKRKEEQAGEKEEDDQVVPKYVP